MLLSAKPKIHRTCLNAGQDTNIFLQKFRKKLDFRKNQYFVFLLHFSKTKIAIFMLNTKKNIFVLILLHAHPRICQLLYFSLSYHFCFARSLFAFSFSFALFATVALTLPTHTNYLTAVTSCRRNSTHPPPDMQDTELTGEVSPAPAAGPAATPPAADQPEQPGAGEEEGRDPEEAAAHHSSGYASSDSSGVGGQAATTTPLTEAAPPIALAQPTALAVSIQSDPQQSAFRPALPAQQVHTPVVGQGYK